MPTAKEATKQLAKRLARAAAVERRVKLTPKQARFVEEITSDTIQSKREAALKAGYSEAGAHVRAAEAVRSRNVQEAIGQALQTRVTKLEMTREASAQRLHELAEQARALGQLAVAARCEELAGRLHGLYVERAENINVNVELAKLSAAQLRDVAAQMAERLQRIAGTVPGPHGVQVIDNAGHLDGEASDGVA